MLALSNIFSIFGKGKGSFVINLFNFLKSVHNRIDPSGLEILTKGKAQFDLEGSIIPASKSVLISVLISSTSFIEYL